MRYGGREMDWMVCEYEAVLGCSRGPWAQMGLGGSNGVEEAQDNVTAVKERQEEEQEARPRSGAM